MNKVIKNYLYNASYQLLLIILPIITTPYVSRVLGADGVGTYSYTNSITQYFILFGCIGLNLYGQREIAYYQNDVRKRNRTFFELVFLRAITISISLIIFYLTMVQFSKYSSIFLIQTLDIIASIFDISWFFQGIEDFKRTVLRNFLVRLLCVTLIFIFVKSPADLPLYVLCYSGTLFLGNISLWLYMPKYVNKNDINGLNIKKHIRPAVMLFLPQIATSLYTYLDKTMIGYITDNTAEVAYYEQSQTIVKTVMTVITSLGTAMMPRIANLFKTNQYEEIKKYMNASIKFVLLLAIPFTFGIMGIAKGFVPWFFGEGYEKVVPNMMLIAPIIIFIGMSTITGTQYLLPLGRQKEYTLSVIAGAVINFILNIIFISIFGSIGAAIGTLIAEFAVMGFQLYFIRKEFSLLGIFKQAIKYTLFGLIMFIVVILLSNILSVSIVSTFVEIFVGAIVYGLLLLISKDSIFDILKAKIAERRAR
ncbi:flippase [Erysipelatoclostridium sp. An173]|uniref:flippase n=1 Tax=Erysipelatoclostridium sp. An173 TaxID=1965571 RepID=UPI000B366E33|nr:flippase [Erysipelatoclostridium sp. An173]OUP73992.1 flippase [Erysipelatoclostridium sp. An173]